MYYIPNITQFSLRGFRSEQMWYPLSSEPQLDKKENTFFTGMTGRNQPHSEGDFLFLCCWTFWRTWVVPSFVCFLLYELQQPLNRRLYTVSVILNIYNLKIDTSFSISRKVVWITFPFSLAELVILLLQSGFAALNEVGLPYTVLVLWQLYSPLNKQVAECTE